MNYNGFPGNLTYDSRGRLSRIQFSGSGAVFYSYDYAYDNFGNRIKKSYVGGSTVENYSWTRGRLLSGITDYSGGTIGSYTYNADGIRYSKTVGGVTTTYYYDGSMLLGEDRSDGKKLRYCYDREGLCGFRYYNGSQWKSYTYVKNIQGDIVLIKDEMGVPRVKYSYDPWGNVTAESLNLDGGATNPEEAELATLNPFRYRGYYFDEESKLYYLITRYYDPWCGQFISPDSFSYLDPETIGGINLYAYCNYNPIMYVDPRGQAFFVFFCWCISRFRFVIYGFSRNSSCF